MGDPKLLVYALNYAPEPSGTAPYTASFARHAVAEGWAVTVVAGVPHYPAWERQPYERDSVVDGVRVLRSSHVVPTNPDAVGRAAMEGSFLASGLPMALGRSSADAVIGVVPALSSGVLGAIAARRLGVPFILWIQDLMSAGASQSGVAGSGRVEGVVSSLERRVARSADRILVPGEGFRSELVGMGVESSRIEVTRNWALLPPAARDVASVRAQYGLPDGPVALHSGNIGNKQGLDVIVDAARVAPQVTFVLQGDGSERARLESLSEGLGNVVFLPTLDDQDLADLLAAADVLVLAQRPSVTTMSLPSKVMNYLASGQPIVASVHTDSEASQLLGQVDAGTIVAPGDGDLLARSVLEAIENSGGTDVDVGRIAGPDRVATAVVGALDAD